MNDFDPSALGRDRDPYPQLAALRASGPVVRLANGFWAVTGYDAVHEVLRARACASGPIAGRYLAALPEGAARDEMSHRINFLDAPDHTRVRSLVSKAFTPRRVETLLPWIAATATTLADAIPTGRPFDLLTEFAHQLPSLVISELLGVPAADRDRLTTWADAVAPLLALEVDDATRAAALAASEQFHAYLGALLDERRRTPGDDLLSALLAAEEGGERLTRVELLSLAATLYSAGHRTTRDLFTNGMSVLLSTPTLWDDVVAGRAAPAEVVEEFLRYATPTLFVVRIPTAAVVAGGVEIAPFEPILVYLAAANRDPARFTAPDVFRPGRREPDPASFAHGAHFCIGASLARAEARIMLETAATRWPTLALAGAAPLRWHQRGPFRGLDALPVLAR
jgi:cytochrome P450